MVTHSGNDNERCGSCGGKLKLNRDGYPLQHPNRGDGDCVNVGPLPRR